MPVARYAQPHGNILAYVALSFRIRGGSGPITTFTAIRSLPQLRFRCPLTWSCAGVELIVHTSRAAVFNACALLFVTGCIVTPAVVLHLGCTIAASAPATLRMHRHGRQWRPAAVTYREPLEIACFISWARLLLHPLMRCLQNAGLHPGVVLSNIRSFLFFRCCPNPRLK